MKRILYVVNFILCLCIWYFLPHAMMLIDPVKQPFLCNDPLLAYKYKPGTMSLRLLQIISLGWTPVLIILSELFRFHKFSSIKEKLLTSFKRTFLFFYFYVINFVLLHVLMVVPKLFTGSYRPYFFDVCQPDKLPNCEPNTYIYDYECTKPAPPYPTYLTSSFFSGHAALTAYTATFSVLYLQFRFHSPKTAKFYSFWLSFIQAIIVSLGFFGCISRYTDHHHSLTDVNVGAAIGIFTAIHIFYTHYNDFKVKNFKDDDDDDLYMANIQK